MHASISDSSLTQYRWLCTMALLRAKVLSTEALRPKVSKALTVNG